MVIQWVIFLTGSTFSRSWIWVRFRFLDDANIFTKQSKYDCRKYISFCAKAFVQNNKLKFVRVSCRAA